MQIRVLDPAAWEAYGKAIRAADPKYRCVTRNWRLYVDLMHAKAFGLEVGGQVVSFAAIYFNVRPKADGWGKYINSYLVYTIPECRQQGYGSGLHRIVEKRALAHGWSRTQSLIQTYAGFRFHLRLGHTFWGVTPKGELRCDSPLDHQSTQAGIGVPTAARDAINAHPLSVAELIKILHNSPLYEQYPREHLQAVFDTHPLGYDPDAFQPRAALL